MESVHGVDVSWLHRPQKDTGVRSRAVSSPTTPKQADARRTPQTPPSHTPSTPDVENTAVVPKATAKEPDTAAKAPTEALKHATTTVTTGEGGVPRAQPRRPNLLSRNSSERITGDSARSPRRGSWISNISSRFSSGAASPTSSPAIPQLSKPTVNGTHTTNAQPDLEKIASPTPSSPGPAISEDEELQPYYPSKPKESSGSFFSSLTRKLSTTSQGGGGSARVAQENGGVCARRTMNINPNKSRCRLIELDQSKLRRVSFSVDVEIAGGPKYKDDEPATDKSKKTKDKKMSERAEGEALKHPNAASELKDEEDAKGVPAEESLAKGSGAEAAQVDDQDKLDGKTMTRKQEKKKRSEEERKERKEKQRKKAEENGTVPVELKRESSNDSSPADSVTAAKTPPKPNERPTTDPVRIYRRCCQLRESPILKRITEQLMKPDATIPGDSGTVAQLNLKGSRLQLADFVTLGDWLAIVPVKYLSLEDADISDEGLRVVLAGLLAAKKPEPTRLRASKNDDEKSQPQRTGVIHKLVLKNNPKITRIGWKYLALFLNMCRSIKAIDLSMLEFPQDLPPGISSQALKSPPASTTTKPNLDAADVFSRALAERLGGSKLSELIMSECSLDANQISKVVDGVIACGVTRLGLAGTKLDDEGLEHVLRYIRSGLCTAVDIGSNDLGGKMDKLAAALKEDADCPVWGLSLASCNLDIDSLQSLLPALAKLPNFRFIDLSHNPQLFENDASGGTHLLRKYLPVLANLKRLHLDDVDLNTKQAIALAEVLPESPGLAHLSILGNAQLSKLVAHTDDASQEEACALYASLMAATRLSSTIVCIDIDVPPADNSEIVKALAKQIVAYCLRNMERMSLDEAVSSAVRQLPNQLGDKDKSSLSVPDVLFHLMGNGDGKDDDPTGDIVSPDQDYIVGGAGVVKALQYCLGDKAQELRRSSNPRLTSSGRNTPRNGIERSISGEDVAERRGKAKAVSKNLLVSARNIRGRLRPALIQEATTGDDMAYRRLLFLDSTLESMIQRFENEFPECRLKAAAAAAASSDGPLSPSLGSDANDSNLSSGTSALRTSASSRTTSSATDTKGAAALAEQDIDDEDEDDGLHVRRPTRRDSEVSLASRALSVEEGRMLRLGHGIRQDIMNAPSTVSNSSREATPDGVGDSTAAKRGKTAKLKGAPGATTAPAATTGRGRAGGDDNADADDGGMGTLDSAQIAEINHRLDELGGQEYKDLANGGRGLQAVMDKIGANIVELRHVKEQDPDGWAMFVESQRAARRNAGV